MDPIDYARPTPPRTKKPALVLICAALAAVIVLAAVVWLMFSARPTAAPGLSPAVQIQATTRPAPVVRRTAAPVPPPPIPTH